MFFFFKKKKKRLSKAMSQRVDAAFTIVAGFPHASLADVVFLPCRMFSPCSQPKILHAHTHQEGAE